MNFYKHHIGDYAQATGHLSFVEDAAYSRLLRKYYAEERPIPGDMKAAQRLVGARTREERDAVETVLHEFFVLESDGWHNKRAEAELAKWRTQADTNRRIAEEREARRASRSDGHASFNESSDETLHESLNESSPKREPNQKPEARSQKPEATTSVGIPNTATSDEVARSRPSDGEPGTDPPALTLVEPTRQGPPDCPHQRVLSLWAEVLPAMPQHDPQQWRGARADHLRARWRETAAAKGWRSEGDGLTYFRRLFAYVGQSAFLTGRSSTAPGKRPFVVELAWLVKPENWAKTIEGKYHTEAA